jgi:3-hydroxyisobutyrate dehydrogenase
MKTKIAFIGLGNMGLPMALNLTKSKKFKVVGYDINISSQKKFKSKGGKIADSLEDLINSVDIIITCLPGPKQITDVAFGKKRIINSLDKKKIWIDFSTNSISCFNKIKKKLGNRIINFIDAPISGGNLKAKSNTNQFHVSCKGNDCHSID